MSVENELATLKIGIMSIHDVGAKDIENLVTAQNTPER